MSGSDSYPPPGAQPPGGYFPPPGSGGAPPPGYPTPPPQPGPPGQQWASPPPGYYPQQALAAHKPGAIPLRPLGLGDIYDAAFKIIRFNPKATVGSSVIVTSIAMLVPVIVTGVLSFTAGLSISPLESEDPQMSDLAGLFSAYGALLVGLLLSNLGQLMVTGMNAHVALAAASGHKLGLGQAWAATLGKRWRLVGLTALLSLGTLLVMLVGGGIIVVLIIVQSTTAAIVTGVVLVPALICLLVWLWVRVAYLAVPPLMLEQVGVFGALGRAFRLTKRQFWRTFGIALLTGIITQIGGSILSTPITLVGQLFLASDPNGQGVFIFILANAIGAVVAAAVVAPFVTTVTSLQYLDQRIRKEAFDLELMRRAGIIGS